VSSRETSNQYMCFGAVSRSAHALCRHLSPQSTLKPLMLRVIIAAPHELSGDSSTKPSKADHIAAVVVRHATREHRQDGAVPWRQARDVGAFDAIAPLFTQLAASAGHRAPEAGRLHSAPRYPPHRAQAHSVLRHAMHPGTVGPLANRPRPHPPVGTGSRPRS